MGFVRHIVGFIAAFLFTVLSAVAMPMMPTVSYQAVFFPLHAATAVEHTNVHFATRAPPTSVSNVAITGDATVKHGMETQWASLNFGADLYATNSGSGFGDLAKFRDELGLPPAGSGGFNLDVSIQNINGLVQ